MVPILNLPIMGRSRGDSKKMYVLDFFLNLGSHPTSEEKMNIGQLAKESGLSSKQIRHYEEIGLIQEPVRNENGYRMYGKDDIHFLKFIKRSRELGFSLEDIKDLIGLWKNKSRSSKEVKKLAAKHLQDLEIKLKNIQEMAHTLKHLLHNCQGDHRPDCPILENLES